MSCDVGEVTNLENELCINASDDLNNNQIDILY